MAFVLFATAAQAQMPREYVMGKISFLYGNNTFSGMYNTQTGESKSLGSFARFTNMVSNDNSYFETGSDLPFFILLTLANGINNKPPLVSSEIKSYAEDMKGTNVEGNSLQYLATSLLHYSASWEIYEGLMLGGHIGWEGIAASEWDKDNVFTERYTVDANYLALAPVIAYQTDYFRAEFKYKFLGASKRIEKGGRQWEFAADYYFSSGNEAFALAFGVYAQKLDVTLPAGRQPNISSAGIRMSFLYYSLYNLF